MSSVYVFHTHRYLLFWHWPFVVGEWTVARAWKCTRSWCDPRQYSSSWLWYRSRIRMGQWEYEPCFSSNATHSICLVELFAEGDDFSWATIQKGRNRYYQQQMVRMNDRSVQDTKLYSSSRPIRSSIRVHKHFRWSQVHWIFIWMSDKTRRSTHRRCLWPWRQHRSSLYQTRRLNKSEAVRSAFPSPSVWCRTTVVLLPFG